jgi:uracil-DNA glycosylase
MTVNEFVDELSSISLPNVFNPYRDLCEVSDHVASADVRRRNLAVVLEAIVKQTHCSLWVGRDLGYRGGRRTGLALTDEFQLPTLEAILGVSGVARATLDPEPVKERTATEVWRLVCEIRKPILLWNVFPFHPYEPKDPLSNRRHNAEEFALCQHILLLLVNWLQPTFIVALGADAAAAVRRLGYDCFRVRHPSYGGHKKFARQIRAIYSIAPTSAD